MGKWTPGPWAVCDDPKNDSWLKGLTVYSVPLGHRVADPFTLNSQDKANARLIAEAPAMAELLERYLASADSPLGMAAIADIDADARALLARLEADK